MAALSSLSSYGTSFQTKVIASLLNRKEFLQKIHDILKVEFFDSNAQKWIITQILNYYYKYHCPPNMEVLKVEVKKIENDILQIAVKEQLKESYKTSDEDSKYVEEEFSNFCKNQQLKSALLASVDLIQANDYDSIEVLIKNALKAGQDKSLGHEYEKDTESRFREDNRIIVPSPWSKINGLLQGGLGNGDFGLIFGNPGGGKSWTLIALGAYAVMNGYNVIHYTLELSEAYVGRRYDAYFTQIPVNEILKHRSEVEKKIATNPGRLIIKEYSPGRASILTVENHIKKCTELDFKPDLIIIDYVDLLSSPRKSSDRKEELDDIYVSTKGLARELNLPIWSVSQVNRAGAKDNVIEGDKSAGSYNKVMITDLAISLSRQRKDKVEGTGRMHIMKNRYGMDGMTYNVNINTATGHIDILDEFDEEQEAELKESDAKSEKDYLRKKFKEFNY